MLFQRGYPWQVTDAGIVAPGEASPRRTPGLPTTLERIAVLFAPELQSVADLRRRRVLAALIATESGGHMDPTPRYEPRCHDYSFGPCQLLTSTAAGLLSDIPHPRSLHLIGPDLTLPDVKTWRDLLIRADIAFECASEYLRRNDRQYGCGGDPIMLHASYNAGSPMLASHPHDKFGLVSYVHPANSTALDSFSKWYGDACAVLKAPTPAANV